MVISCFTGGTLEKIKTNTPDRFENDQAYLLNKSFFKSCASYAFNGWL